ncbi:MAG: bifunctional diaminohydroxyphosphoribosylaminopyrimidine deaminase/5-amino-6-(5-phosphoribosylamino)uracil reductase RibD [Alcanivoracaceae bacterium]
MIADACTDADREYMQRALTLAARGLYTTDPNPRVGCVLVAGEQVVGEGFHQRAGEPHAERHALAQAGDRARGATCYVTLEPCAHTGRTGPCADALVAAGVSRVVAAMQDPHDKVAGKGLEKLRAAGIDVACGLMEAQARALNPGFICRMETGRPFVRLKLAMSLDGRTAMASGESKWITGAQAREQVQFLRARSSAIVTGVGTVLADDPAMTVRPDQWCSAEYPGDPVRQPLRVVLDRSLRTPPGASIVSGPGETLLATGMATDTASAAALSAAGAQLLQLPASGSGVDLAQLLVELAARECNEVLVEAGPTLAAAFVSDDLVDELVVFMAPALLGSNARPLMLLDQLDTMADKITWQFADVARVGDDVCLTLTRARQA